MKLLFDLLSPGMEKSSFTCGEAALDTYLQRQASQDMKRGFASVIVAHPATDPKTIIGYYSLSMASVLLNKMPEEMARKMPRYPNIPAVRLGRLAVASSMQGQHVGSLMVLDALRRSCSNELAWALFLVDAENERVAAFCEKFQFQRFSEDEFSLEFSLWMHRKQAKTLCAGIP